jgi:hypothetical protein
MTLLSHNDAYAAITGVQPRSSALPLLPERDSGQSDWVRQVATLIRQAEEAREQGLLNDALDHSQTAINIIKDRDCDPLLKMECHLEVALVQKSLKDFEHAIEHFGTAHECYNTLRQVIVQAEDVCTDSPCRPIPWIHCLQAWRVFVLILGLQTQVGSPLEIWQDYCWWPDSLLYRMQAI